MLLLKNKKFISFRFDSICYWSGGGWMQYRLVQVRRDIYCYLYCITVNARRLDETIVKLRC